MSTPDSVAHEVGDFMDKYIVATSHEEAMKDFRLIIAHLGEAIFPNA